MDRITDISMTPEQLFRSVVDLGERVDAPVVRAMVPASVQLYGERIAMWGPSGRHFLSLANTDAARLHAHWQGFKEIATAFHAGRMSA